MEMTTWCTCPVAGTHPTIIDHEWYYFRLNGPTNFIATGSLRSSRGRGDHTGVGYGVQWLRMTVCELEGVLTGPGRGYSLPILSAPVTLIPRVHPVLPCLGEKEISRKYEFIAPGDA